MAMKYMTMQKLFINAVTMAMVLIKMELCSLSVWQSADPNLSPLAMVILHLLITDVNYILV